MCAECNETLGEDAIDPQHDEVTDDAEVAKAVENWEKRREYQKKYNSRPDVKEKRAKYMKTRNAKIKDILKRAEALGLKPKGRDTDG
jgi:excinuclease UvrABC helicase subunit UvrB